MVLTRSKQRITDILLSTPAGGFGAVLEKYVLCYQTLDQLPEPPRELIRSAWGNNFRGYTVKPASQGLVAGVLWKLTQDQFQRLNKWECIGTWKKCVSVPVTAYDGKPEQAFTEMVTDDQEIFEIVDGLQYENNLNPREIKTVIDDEYRIKAMKEARAQLQKFAVHTTD
jgi:hypothetical protein